MAFDFIKKVFSFGKSQPAPAQEPEAVTAPEVAPLPPLPDPAAEAADAPAGFPSDAPAMEFTPETAPEPDLSTPEPAHAGEPPIVEAAKAVLPEAVIEEEAVSEPEVAPEPEAQPKPVAEVEPEPESEPAVEVETAADAVPVETAEPVDEKPAASVETIAEAVPEADEAARVASEDAALGVEVGEPEAVIEPPAEPEIEISAPAEADKTETGLPEPASGKVLVGKTVSRSEPVAAPAAPEPEARTSWWQKLRHGLSRSSSQLTGQVTSIFTKRKLDEDTLQDLEDVLIQADLGIETAMRITGALSASRYGKDISPAEVNKVMAAEIEKVLAPVAKPLQLDLSHKPHVILVVGVNGTGKTTTIGKLSAKLSAGGLKVMLAAGDTFRAAAIEQLKIWGDRTGAQVISTKLGADAAGLAYEAFEAAREAKADVLIIDTAGRLQNRTELMDELAKVVRVIGKLDPEAPHTVLQTLDATTGQNALNQVEIFRNIAGVNGLVMTKLDGTARGGILVAIAARHKLPVYFIGVGEGVDDLEPFEAKDFAAAIAGETE